MKALIAVTIVLFSCFASAKKMACAKALTATKEKVSLFQRYDNFASNTKEWERSDQLMAEVDHIFNEETSSHEEQFVKLYHTLINDRMRSLNPASRLLFEKAFKSSMKPSLYNTTIGKIIV